MNNRSVFLCDDDDGVRSSISFLLRQHGLRVVPYASGPELLSAFDQFKNPPRRYSHGRRRYGPWGIPFRGKTLR